MNVLKNIWVSFCNKDICNNFCRLFERFLSQHYRYIQATISRLQETLRSHVHVQPREYSIIESIRLADSPAGSCWCVEQLFPELRPLPPLQPSSPHPLSSLTNEPSPAAGAPADVHYVPQHTHTGQQNGKYTTAGL